MEEKENVYETTLDTEKIAEANSGEEQEKNAEKEVLTVLGKFKDVDALARAYGSLQAEFTRRSQRLKELERQAENLKAVEESSGAEKLRKNAEVRRVETKKFDEFVKQTEEGPAVKQPLNTAEETPQSRSATSEEGYDFAAKTGEDALKGSKVVPSVAMSGNPTFSSEELYERANADEGVRLKIIGEYLASIGRTGAPVTAGRGGVMIAPPMKAKSIGDAGNMALRYFKKGPQV